MQSVTLKERSYSTKLIVRSTLAEVDKQSREQWIDSFKRDLDPDSELTRWEGIALSYCRFCKGRKLTDDVSLRSLTEAQAREAMDEF